MSEQKRVLDELTQWPTKREDATADLMLRIVARDTQVSWLKKWKALEAGPSQAEVYTGHLHAVLAGVGFLLCLRELRDVAPDAADDFARDYWAMCDAGDSVGEVLWELGQQAGLDMELVTLKEATGADVFAETHEPIPAAAAVDPVDGDSTS